MQPHCINIIPEGRKSSEPRQNHRDRWWQRQRGAGLGHQCHTSNAHLRKSATTFFFLCFCACVCVCVCCVVRLNGSVCFYFWCFGVFGLFEKQINRERERVMCALSTVRLVYTQLVPFTSLLYFRNSSPFLFINKNIYIYICVCIFRGSQFTTHIC